MSEAVVAHRRYLHAVPELDFALTKTVAYVEGVLRGFPCRVFSPVPGSVCAWFDGGCPETTAFRADMDALPVTEETGLSFASAHLGNMHACGHDGHTAMLLALAERLAARELPCNVLLIFQPAEETTGGAELLCATGLLDKCRVSRIFGLHLWPGLPAGTLWTRPGPLMARSSEVTLRTTGKSVHISRFREGRDALWAGAEFLRRAYDMAETEPGGERVLRFGRMDSGTVRNAVSGRTELLGSLRSFDDETFETMGRRLRELSETVAAETGCELDLHISHGYPPVCNDAALLDRVIAAMGADAPGLLTVPVLAAEDFSFYQRRVPGLFCFLGVGETPALHASDFDFDDEAILPRGVRFLERLLTI